MRLKKWVEIVLIILTIMMFFRMFMVDEIIGYLYLIGIVINLCIIDRYGRIMDKLDNFIKERGN